MKKRRLERLLCLTLAIVILTMMAGVLAAEVDVTSSPVELEYEEQSDLMLGEPEDEAEHEALPLGEDGIEAFTEGYVRIVSGIIVYKDAALSEVLGRFGASGHAYARLKRETNALDEVLRVTFDTPERNAAKQKPVTGYIRLEDARVMTQHAQSALIDELIMTAACRQYDDIWLPIARFEPMTEAPTEEPTEEPTVAPTEEPTLAPAETPTAEPMKAPTEVPTAEPAEASEDELAEELTGELEEAPVDGRLMATISSLPRYGQVGFGISVGITISGGVAPYAVALNEDRITVDEAGEAFLTIVPQTWGPYALSATVTDADGAVFKGEATVLVSNGARESREDWEAALSAVTLTGDAPADLVAVAQSQLGYAESRENFIVNNVGKLQGYTRYGDWAGQPYADWNALFVDFCRAYANYPDDCDSFGADLAPMVGDIAYLSTGETGIVASVRDGEITVIMGDREDAVRAVDFARGTAEIIGYVGVAHDPALSEPFGSTSEAMKGRTVEEYVIIYSEPSESGHVLQVLADAGTVLDIGETIEAEDRLWHRVSYERVEGYARADQLEIIDYVAKQELVFEQSATVNGVRVTVTAESGVFPQPATLSVKRVPVYERHMVDAAIEQERAETVNVVASYTFDIRVLDMKGNEVEFKKSDDVQVAFTLDEVHHENLDTQVYHVTAAKGGLSAEALKVTTKGDTATVITDGFSYYTVEFTYGRLQYIMSGDSAVPLKEILEYLGLVGEPTAVECSDPELFSANDESGAWMVKAHKPFLTEEWMRVTIDGIAYQIVVTDDVAKAVSLPIYGSPGAVKYSEVQMGTNGTTFASEAPLSTILLISSIINDASNAVPTILSEDPGFVLLSTSELYFDEDRKGNPSDGNGIFVAYDNTAVGASKTSFAAGSDNLFSGDLFRFTYPNAALLPDGTKGDVLLTFSDLHIVTQSNLATTYAGQTYVASGGLLRAGNTMAYPGTNQTRNGLKVNLNISVAYHGSTTLVPGTFLYSMTDIDVVRNGSTSFEKLSGAGANNNYSEQVSVNSGRVGKIYLPDYSGIDDPMTTNTGYKTAVEQYGGGYRFVGMGRSDTDPGTYYSGFVVIADNTAGGINVSAWSAGSKVAAVRTNLLRGMQDILHVIASETGIGGNIVTTLTGNVNGLLDDGGTLVYPPRIEIPEKVNVPDGKTVSYTMKADTAYKIKGIRLWDNDEGTGAPIRTVTQSELEALAADPSTTISVPLATGRTGTLWYDPSTKAYIFTFPDNNYNHKIRVDWEPKKSDLTVEKTVSGTQASRDRHFRIRINVASDPDWHKVDYNGTVGYIRSAMLSVSGNTGVTQVDKTEIYENPDSLSAVLARVSASGTAVTVLETVTLADGDYAIDLSNAEATIPADGYTNVALTNPTTLTLSKGSGTTEVWLSYGQSVSIKNLPSGIRYTVTEPDVESGVASGEVTTATVFSGDTKVSLKNTYEPAVPTGLNDSVAPALWLLALALAVVTGAGHSPVAERRRRSRA